MTDDSSVGPDLAPGTVTLATEAAVVTGIAAAKTLLLGGAAGALATTRLQQIHATRNCQATWARLAARCLSSLKLILYLISK